MDVLGGFYKTKVITFLFNMKLDQSSRKADDFESHVEILFL